MLPLHQVVCQCDVVQVAQLLSPDIVNLRSRSGNTALHVVTYNKENTHNTAIAKLLLKNGGNVNLANRDDLTPLDLAVNLDNATLVTLFLKTATLDTLVHAIAHATAHPNPTIPEILITALKQYQKKRQRETFEPSTAEHVSTQTPVVQFSLPPTTTSHLQHMQLRQSIRRKSFDS